MRALAQPPDVAPGQLLLAFSGGRDSSVLLHAVHALLQAGQLPGYHLELVHVHHGLHPQADDWSAHCARQASRRQVPFTLARVQVQRCRGDDGEEAMAREARYEALLRHLEPGGRLLTAHHADDQLETVLLALARGAGVQGLAAMPAVRPRGAGWHVRPMLDWSVERVTAYARTAGLRYIDDPANESRRHARSYLRHEVVPKLRSRWPSIAAGALRSASHCASASDHEQALAAIDAGSCLATLERMPVTTLLALSQRRQLNLLRAWCRARGVPAPPQRRLEQGLEDMLTCAEDALPCVQWSGVHLRRYRDRLYLGGPPPAIGSTGEDDDPLALPPGLGRLSLTCAAPGEGRARVAADRWRASEACVRYRRGGERVHLAGRAGSRALKHLLQEWGVVPWMRPCLPLLCQGERIVAIADLAVTADFAARPDEPALQVSWEHHPSLF